MINILIPIAGKNDFIDREFNKFPKPLFEINGVSIIQMAIENLKTISQEIQFIFIVSKPDCELYHLDEVLKLVTVSECKIIVLESETKGAACSALMAIEHINNSNSLIVSNFDQIINVNLNNVINFFSQNDCDSGVITFEALHPRWSFVKINEDDLIVEASEKKPISKNAIAGFYYFKKGSDFVVGAMETIIKDAHVDKKFYIAPILNQLILNNKKIMNYKIDNAFYHTFYSHEKIKEYKIKTNDSYGGL